MTLGELTNIVPLTDHSFGDAISNEESPHEFRRKRTARIWIASPLEIYTGLFVQKCMHQIGTYKWYLEDGAYQYEGKIYANQIHGYGQLTYPDGSNYQGLFRHNKRFGPGVVTSADGMTQDVGIWYGSHLVRLNQTFSSIEKIPNIARSINAKAHLLTYKDIVPIGEKYKDVAKNILQQLGASDDLLNKSDQLYSPNVRNPNSTFFNEKLFFQTNFSKDTDMYIEIQDYDENMEPIYRQVLVKKLLAWNNDNLSIEVMIHAFMHRNDEKLLSFRASDVLTNRRHLFLPPGEEETNCLKFLRLCQKHSSKLVHLITTKDVYVNVTDSEGNNGVTYAVFRNQTEAIKILTNFGANLNNINDECMTPLMIGILKYITVKFQLSFDFWETCFLFDSADKEYKPLEGVGKWPEHSHESDSLNDGRYSRRSRTIIERKYFFDLSYARNDSHKVDACLDGDAEEIEETTKTILCLLEHGADPNIGEVPFPPIITAVFSKSQDIVQFLLDYGANIFIKTAEEFGSLSPLHILASIPCTIESARIAAVLLKYGANPDELCSNNHWLSKTETLLAGTTVETDTGKTPLHLLCMRTNFTQNNIKSICQLASELLAGGADPNLQYLGHTPLSLAIVSGNVTLVRNLLATGIVNPNAGLGNKMGVALSVLTLVRYRNIIPLSISQEIFCTLAQYYANPFIDVPDYEGNVIEFVFNENATAVRKKSTEKVKKPNVVKKEKTIAQSPIEKQFKSMAEQILLAHVYRKICQLIYHYKFFYAIEDDIFDILAMFIPSMKIVIVSLQMLIDYNLIMITEDTCLIFLQYMSIFCQKETPKKEKKSSLPSRPSDLMRLLNFSPDYKRYERFFFENPMPAIDPDASRYHVCFECLQKTNKHLIICPVCNLIFFCSEKCNKLNNDRKVITHPCKVLFYDRELKKIEDLSEERTREKSVFFSEEKRRLRVDLFHNMFVQVIPNAKPISISRPPSLREEEARVLLRHSISTAVKFDKHVNLATLNSDLLTKLSTVKEAKKRKRKGSEHLSDDEGSDGAAGKTKDKRKGRKKGKDEDDEGSDEAAGKTKDKRKGRKKGKDVDDKDKDGEEPDKIEKPKRKAETYDSDSDSDSDEDVGRIKEEGRDKRNKREQSKKSKQEKKEKGKTNKHGKKGEYKDESESKKFGKKGLIDDDENKSKKRGKKGLIDDDDSEFKKRGKKDLIDFDEKKSKKRGKNDLIDFDENKSKKRGKKDLLDFDENKSKKRGKKGLIDDDESESKKRGKKGLIDDDENESKKRGKKGLTNFDENKSKKRGKKDLIDDSKSHEKIGKKKKKLSESGDEGRVDTSKSRKKHKTKNIIHSDEDVARGKSKSRKKHSGDRRTESGDYRKSKRGKDSKKLHHGKRSVDSSTDNEGSTRRARGKSAGKHQRSRAETRERSRGTMKNIKQGEAGKISTAVGRRRSDVGQRRKSRSVSVRASRAQLQVIQKEIQTKLNEDGLTFTKTGSRVSERKDVSEVERLDRQSISKEFKDSLSNICHEFDHKFWQMFMPYCIYVDGQLYYKFDNEFYQKITYSCV